MKKILFSDMDGTILDFDSLLNDQDKVMIDKLRGQGHLVAFNTGRNLEEALKAVKRLKLNYDYLVLNNGAQIIDHLGNELFKQVISKETGIDIIDHCLKYSDMWIYFYDGKQTLAYYNGDTYCYDHHGNKTLSNDHDFVKEYPLVKEFDIIALHQDNQEINDLLKIQAYIKEKYDTIAHGTLNTFYLDITPGNCTKGTGIKTLVELLNEEVATYAIGDSFNDLTMFESADHSYTFNHVDKQIAKNTDGQVAYVADLIEMMLE